jgi:hypothetical protein
MRKIPLTHGFVTIVDDGDYEYLNRRSWHACIKGPGKQPYARCSYRANGVRVNVYLHRLLLPTSRGIFVDHVNRDTLDNRRANLRPCTPSQSTTNQVSRKITRTGFRGVSPRAGSFGAEIHRDGMAFWLGTFRDPIAAARAYDDAARRLHGEFAVLNFPPGEAA